MALTLRTQITRPLTHQQLDDNFIFIQIIKWVRRAYEIGELVIFTDQNNNSDIFYCEYTHSEFTYNGNQFVESVVINSVSTLLWRRIGSVKSFTSATLDGTILNFINLDGSVVSVELNNLKLNGVSILNGITTHTFLKLTEVDFTTQTFNSIFTNSSSNTNVKSYDLLIENIPGKVNIIVLDVNSFVNEDYIVVLPELVSLNDKGKIVKIITKRNNISNTNFNLLVATTWNNSSQYRIIAPSIKTEVNNIGYFVPLESMETIELIFDGDDYLVTSTQKQQYVEVDAANYLTNISQYVIRDIGELL